ncbi:hypothetical protein LTS14_010096 [Recurvomyces mirabilis]|uniref:uncharacterized protein n=1 Tax=Recurvomyces mirabilis TaxID=574656 RepID=UPI002DDFE78B|nr:hypothetical protein LTS14_010096 [Recurvomyces mirabilis]
MSAPRRSTREREVRYEVQPDMNEDPGSESPQHEAEEEEEEIESEAGDAVIQQEPSENAEATSRGENALVAKYGSLYAAVDDKQRRKELYDGHYQDFLVQSEPNKLKSEHLAQRKKMWADGRERIAGEIDELEAKIGRLRAKQEQMDVAEAELEEKIGEDAEKWEDDKVKLAEWKAFFDLETDKVDV